MTVLTNNAYSEEKLEGIIDRLKEIGQTYDKNFKDLDTIKQFFEKMHEKQEAATAYIVMKPNIVTTLLTKPNDLNNYDKIYTITLTGKNDPELILTQFWSKD